MEKISCVYYKGSETVVIIDNCAITQALRHCIFLHTVISLPGECYVIHHARLGTAACLYSVLYSFPLLIIISTVVHIYYNPLR